MSLTCLRTRLLVVLHFGTPRARRIGTKVSHQATHHLKAKRVQLCIVSAILEFTVPSVTRLVNHATHIVRRRRLGARRTLDIVRITVHTDRNAVFGSLGVTATIKRIIRATSRPFRISRISNVPCTRELAYATFTNTFATMIDTVISFFLEVFKVGVNHTKVTNDNIQFALIFRINRNSLRSHNSNKSKQRRTKCNTLNRIQFHNKPITLPIIIGLKYSILNIHLFFAFY